MTQRDRLRIVVLGMMGAYPFAGQAWLFLNWLCGLARLGHDVWYVEDDVLWPYQREGQSVSDMWAAAVTHVRSCVERIGLGDRWALRFSPDDLAWGRKDEEIDELYRSCDVLLNVVGTRLREPQLQSRLRVYVETDPVTHELMWATGDPFPPLHFSEHHVIATYGENYGAPDCGVPLNGVTYVKTRQPVDLEHWQTAWTPDAGHFTTIGNYRQAGKDVEYGGETYHWSKHHEWQKFIDLPARTGQTFLLGVNASHDDVAALKAKGWQVTSPLEMSRDVFGAYPEFIRGSRAEFTVAKDQNVRLRSGWFSERDACYLASGKPVVAQDTAFGNILPTGEGLFAVNDLDEAAAAVDTINSDYARHCSAARDIAEEFFQASIVAGRLLQDVGAT
ncbi:MAG: glycosyltransferase [Actinomycetes bacterium]